MPCCRGRDCRESPRLKAYIPYRSPRSLNTRAWLCCCCCCCCWCCCCCCCCSVRTVSPQAKPYNGYVSLSLSLSLSLSPCDSPWPTAAGRASSPWLRPRKQGSSGGPSVSGPLPQRSPVADRRPRFRFASAIVFLDSRSRNLKPKPQALNRKKNRRLRRSEHGLALKPNPEGERGGSASASAL